MACEIELEIRATDEPGVYEVEVESPAGGTEATIHVDAQALLARRRELSASVLASSATARRLFRGLEQPVREIGETMFRAVFTDRVYGRYAASAQEATRRGEPLRLVLHLRAPDLAALPWETLFDPETDEYLCQRDPLVRYVETPLPTTPLKVDPPLRILGIVASPRGLPTLDVADERRRLEEALGELIRHGLVELVWTSAGTWPVLQEQLQAGPWHIVHFIGHGGFDESEGGVLAFEKEVSRDVETVSAVRFGRLLHSCRPVPRLVVLNACESGETHEQDTLSSTAAALVHSGISAAVAMQFEITDAAALAFSRGLYRAIARNTPVDEAVRLGRIAIVGTSEQTLEWVTPVLYLRTAETCLFAVSGLDERHTGPVETEDGPRDDETTDSHADNDAGPGRRWAWLAGAVAIVVLGFVAARLFAGGGGTTATITRVQGPDRYATSAAVADAAFASAGARSAVIARGDDLADALAAAALAGASRGPVLLVPNDHLPDVGADIVRRLGVQRAVVIGDDAAVSADVQRAVEALGVTTSRVSGGDPVSVAAAIADEVQPGLWPGQGATAFLIDHQDVAAAATVGPIAFAEQIPILFTSRAELPVATREALTRNGIAHVLIVGGHDLIPTAVETELRAEAGVTTQRLQSRSSDIVAIERSQLRWRSREVVLARGDNPADAVAAAALAGRSRAPLVLTASRNELGADASAALTQLAGKVKNLVIVGDPTAVSEQLVSAAAARLRLKSPERAIVRA